MRANPAFSAEKVITELEVGEALVSFLDSKGRPSVVEQTDAEQGQPGFAVKRSVVHISRGTGKCNTYPKHDNEKKKQEHAFVKAHFLTR